MPLNKMILSKYKNDIFVESGSHIGRSIDVALECGFKEIHSIELSSKFYTYCSKKYFGNQKVHLYLGDSSEVLKFVLPKIKDRNKTIWLDGHFSGSDTVCGSKYSPLMEELEIIKYYYKKRDIIIVDDLRCWVKGEHCDFDVNDIKEKLLQINGNFEFIYEDSYQGDILLFQRDILIAK
jgi:hypothetical protein